MIYFALAGWALSVVWSCAWWVQRIRQAQPPSATVGSPLTESPRTSTAPVGDPGKQALEMLRRGENCDWYSIKHDPGEMHEAFDSLEIYWRTNVEQPEKNGYHIERGPFELKAGFRVRWRVAATNRSYVEAVGLDLLTTIREARELADRLVERQQLARSMEYRVPMLEAWKARGSKRRYSFHGLDIDKWYVRLEFPGGIVWAEEPSIYEAATAALAKAPQ